MAIKPNILASMGYHIFFTMVRRSSAIAQITKRRRTTLFFNLKKNLKKKGMKIFEDVLSWTNSCTENLGEDAQAREY